MTLWGCTPWWAQLSVCMNTPISTFRSAFESSEWFKKTEAKCLDSCQIRNSPSMCVECWSKSLTKSESAFNIYCGIKEGLCDKTNSRETFLKRTISCMSTYIPAHVDETTPKVKASNLKAIGEYKMLKARVKLPRNRPGNWWALTVNLPCRPPLFIYKNAFCIKDEDERSRRTSFSLTQNKRSGSHSMISFEAVFNSRCNFTSEDIGIVWDESFPAQKFPQVSSLPLINTRRLKDILQSKLIPGSLKESVSRQQQTSRSLLNDLGLIILRFCECFRLTQQITACAILA